MLQDIFEMLKDILGDPSFWVMVVLALATAYVWAM